MARDFPESDAAAHWRTVSTAVPLTFCLLTTLVYLMRLYAAIRIVRRVRTEDYLMGIAVLLMLGHTGSVLTKAYNGMGVPDSDLPQYRQVNFKLGSWLVIKFWSASMVFAKLAIILFLRRITGSKRSNRIALDTLSFLVVIWGLFNFIFTIVFCNPVSYYWDRTIYGGWCIDSSLYIIESKTIAWTALVTDVLILAVPASTIWRSRFTLKQKVGVTFILCVGIVVCIFSALRALQFSFYDTSHLSTSSMLLGLLTALENYFTITCGCLPQLGALFHHNPLHCVDCAKGSGYLGSYDAATTIRTWGFSKMSAIETRVIGTRPATEDRSNNSREGPNSSDIELQGIEVHTTINQEVSTGNKCEEEHYMPWMRPSSLYDL